MGMPAAVYYTADMVRALPDDGKRYETVHGAINSTSFFIFFWMTLK